MIGVRYKRAYNRIGPIHRIDGGHNAGFELREGVQDRRDEHIARQITDKIQVQMPGVQGTILLSIPRTRFSRDRMNFQDVADSQ